MFGDADDDSVGPSSPTAKREFMKGLNSINTPVRENEDGSELGEKDRYSAKRKIGLELARRVSDQ